MSQDSHAVLRDLEAIPLQERPHVVVLGAGSSFAATPQAERRHRRTPLMSQLADTLELRTLLGTEAYNQASADFESFFDELISQGQSDLVSEIETRTFELFDSFQLSEEATLYDRLVLALRAKDTIVTFNWDPLLPYAYRRNGFLRTLPSLWFLHGNVKLGSCKEHNRIGWNDDVCQICGKKLDRVPLLYPIRNKDYDSHPVIRESWQHFQEDLTNSYFVTMFGYSAPKTDAVAYRRMVDGLKNNAVNGLLQFEVIDPNAAELISTRYADVYRNLHATELSSFSGSWLSRHPRLTCEALYQATMMLEPIMPYPMPESDDLSELQQWYEDFSSHFGSFQDEVPPWNKPRAQ